MAESETDELQDTEITLGTGKLLGIFFGLVLLCSVFFTMGYMFGRANATGSKTEIVGSESTAGAAGKPSAVNKSGETGPVAATSQPSQVPASASPAPATSTAPATLAPVSTTATQPQNSATTGGTYMVQVAAVSKQEDADLLVNALQKKQYPVFVASAPGDALFHVQVGPFTDPKDAETMRSRLASDGYNAIVKK
jgi:cell division septation protein DedD